MRFISDYFDYIEKEEAQCQNLVSSHEFIWINATLNLSLQSFYIGAELMDDFLIFYLIIPSKNFIHIIKSYQLNSAITSNSYINNNEIINKNWFNYKELENRIEISILNPYTNGCEVFTDHFLFNIHSESSNSIKILEITMPKEFLKN